MSACVTTESARCLPHITGPTCTQSRTKRLVVIHQWGGIIENISNSRHEDVGVGVGLDERERSETNKSKSRLALWL